MINPIPAPGSEKSNLPATRQVVSETSYGNQNATAPLAKRPSRFDKQEKVDPAQLTAQQLRIKQRQQKVQERISTVELGFIFLYIQAQFSWEIEFLEMHPKALKIFL